MVRPTDKEIDLPSSWEAARKTACKVGSHTSRFVSESPKIVLLIGLESETIEYFSVNSKTEDEDDEEEEEEE